MLTACHERIRDNLVLARRIATERQIDPEDLRQAAERVQRYFGIALPLHVADEDASIAPRLASSSAVLSVTLDVMHQQHLTYHPLLEWLVDLCSRVAQKPEEITATRELILQTLALLETPMQTHLELEEQVVFPAVARLSTEVQASIVSEMRARRAEAL